MTVEAPEAIRRGEQIGLRLDIFNNWDNDLEAKIINIHLYTMPEVNSVSTHC